MVFSLSAILVTESPVLISAQMSFWLWLRGEDTEQLGDITLCKQYYVYDYLRYLQSNQARVLIKTVSAIIFGAEGCALFVFTSFFMLKFVIAGFLF